MAVPIRHIDLLRQFVADTSHPVWARDLVCLVANTGGTLLGDDIYQIWEEFEQGATTPTQTLSAGIGTPYPKVELLKLTHHQGVNALADNQEISFCNEGITLLFGQNRSGKSGYFRILNQLAVGAVAYTIHPHLYTPTPAPISVSVEYTMDGVAQPVFTWDGVSACPQALRHIRCFDSHYASRYLESRGNNTYLFESYSLKVFRGIYDTLHYLKNELKLTIDPAAEGALTGLCTAAYRDALSQALITEFRQELVKFGMGNLQVDLVVDDLMVEDAKIGIRIVNNLAVDSVLSEAELKCVSLSLFLAECELMAVPQPIIFDDPVNSLDAVIIQAFANRIRNLSCEVVVFTHNILLLEALTDERKFKVYDAPGAIRTSAKKHVLVYDVLSNANRAGFIVGRNAKKTLFYLDLANTDLASAVPLSNLDGVVHSLRMAVEWAIDEVVFRGLAPHRFKGSENNDWKEMKAMANAGDQNVVDLKKNYDDLSAMGVHVGASSYAVTPTIGKLQAIHDEILRIFRTVYP
jgi:energy-coupling factor transporter ATP-binding protein EcfA2